MLEEMKKKQEDYCVEIVSAGIKDIILPGEIREIMNLSLIHIDVQEESLYRNRLLPVQERLHKCNYRPFK